MIGRWGETNDVTVTSLNIFLMLADKLLKQWHNPAFLAPVFYINYWKLNSSVPVTQSQTLQIKMDSLKAMSNDNASSSI